MILEVVSPPGLQEYEEIVLPPEAEALAVTVVVACEQVSDPVAEGLTVGVEKSDVTVTDADAVQPSDWVTTTV